MGEKEPKTQSHFPSLGLFGRKLLLMFLAIALAPLVGYGFISLQNLRQFNLRSAEHELDGIVKMITLLCEAQEALDRIGKQGGAEVDQATGASPAWQTGDRFLTLRELIRGIRVGRTGYCYVLDSSGTFQVHPQLERQNLFAINMIGGEELKRIRQDAIHLAPGEVKTIHYPWPVESGKLKTKLAKVGYFKPYDWIIIVALFEDEALTPFYTDIKFLLGFLLLTLVVTVILALLVSRYLMRPIAQLTRASTALAHGDFGVQLPPAGNDEIGAMAQSFGVMTRRLGEAHADLVEWSRTLEQKVLERTEELEKAHDRVLMQEKMASLGKLSAMVAHEINNPLSGVLSYLKLTMKLLGREALPPPSSEKLNQYLELSAGEVKRVGEIVKNLLMFSKQSFGEFKWDNLGSIVDKSIALIKHSAEMKNVDLDKESGGDGSDRLYCDSSGIQQMFVALMVNAIEAMEKGGKLRVRTDYRSETAITIQVVDTGKGIAEDILPRIFEPFFSLKESKKSIGMGLSVVYGIVQSHGGTVQVSSKLGQGTTFTIVLPRERPAARIEEQPPTDANA